MKRGAELLVALWAAITFGALLASYMAFRPVRDALVLGDWDRLPWLFTGTLVAVSVLAYTVADSLAAMAAALPPRVESTREEIDARRAERRARIDAEKAAGTRTASGDKVKGINKKTKKERLFYKSD